MAVDSMYKQSLNQQIATQQSSLKGLKKSQIPGLESLTLSIFDVHLDYIKDFGKNLIANLECRDQDVMFYDELDAD